MRDAAYALEDNAVFEYRDRQAFGTMCGVDSLYRQVVPLDSLRTEGVFQLQFGDFPEAYVGQGMAYALGIRVNLNSPISVYVPRRGRVSPLLPYSFYKKQNIFPSGVFALEAEVDGKYVIVPLHFAQQLLDYPGQASSVAIRLEADASPQRVQRVQQQIGQWLGDDYKIQSRYQQKESFYRIMMYEKWGIYFIILLVLVIASFSLIGSLVMLIIEKRKDSQTLVTMGADTKLLRKIFVAEGMLIYLIGAGGGLLLGVALALAQQHFGFLKLSGETFLIDAYPVEVHPSDLAWVIVTFVSVSYLISVLTVRAMIPKKEISQNRP